MQFLVEHEITLPPDDGSEARADLVRRERARAAEIVGNGHIRHVWIVPGRRARISVWEAQDAAHLHALMSSLPASYWSDARVRPLVERPIDDLVTTAGWGTEAPQ
jgi:muconolactone D-isomerase